MQKKEHKDLSNNAWQQVSKSATSKRFRVLLVATLIVLSVQGRFGDTVNIFYATRSTPVPAFSLAGFTQQVSSLGFPLIYHAYEGIFLIGLAALVFALSFRWSKHRGVRIASGLGLLMVVSAAIGGFLFVMSGFSN